jgi:hypothetical protein
MNADLNSWKAILNTIGYYWGSLQILSNLLNKNQQIFKRRTMNYKYFKMQHNNKGVFKMHQ